VLSVNLTPQAFDPAGFFESGLYQAVKYSKRDKWDFSDPDFAGFTG
jgi:hypothetical protein